MEANILQNCYNHLGAYIQATLRTDDDQPLFDFIDLWNEQTERSEEDYPIDFKSALFIDFDISSMPRGVLEADMDISINFYVAFETLEDTHIGAQNQAQALQAFSHLLRLQAILEGYTAEESGSLVRQGIKKFNTRSNLIVYVLSYKTALIDHNATEERKATVTVTLDVEPTFIKRPHTDPTPLPPDGDLFDLT